MNTKTASFADLNDELARLLDQVLEGTAPRGGNKRAVNDVICAIRDRFPEQYPDINTYIELWNTEIKWGST